MSRNFRYLVPVSDSPGSHNAKNYAISLFSGIRSEGSLLHVLEKEETDETTITFFDSFKDSDVLVQSGLREIIRKGGVVEEILSTSSSIDPDLMVISSMGHNTENRFFSSQRTTEVVISSYYPILIIPPDVSFSPINTIVFATDMRSNNVALVQEILHLFRNFRCTIHLLVWSSEKPHWHYREEVKHMVASLRNYWDYDKIFVSLLETRNLLIQLEMFLKEQKADLLAFNKNNDRFRKIFFQNPEKQMPCCTDLPILALAGQVY